MRQRAPPAVGSNQWLCASAGAPIERAVASRLRPRSTRDIRTMEPTMRIAQLAPLMESVPPALYGGTERVVASLTDELVRRDHEVTLFASGDSQTLARLVPIVPESLRPAGLQGGAIAYHLTALSRALDHAGDF